MTCDLSPCDLRLATCDYDYVMCISGAWRMTHDAAPSSCAMGDGSLPPPVFAHKIPVSVSKDSSSAAVIIYIVCDMCPVSSVM
jgi:hypothetical protein